LLINHVQNPNTNNNQNISKQLAEQNILPAEQKYCQSRSESLQGLIIDNNSNIWVM
jgi:hypothetical protein